MPLDYSLWQEVETRVLSKRGNENESLDSYKRRLSITAKQLPKSLIRNVLSKMKEHIQATVDSHGKNTQVE